MTIKLDQIFNIYSMTDKKDHPRLLGRILVTPTEMAVLADYDGNFQGMGGGITPKKLKRFGQWCGGSHSFGVSLQDLKEGMHPEVIPEKKMPDLGEAPLEGEDEKWFKVQRDDLDDPMLIKFKEGKAYIADSDQPLGPEELGRILTLASKGEASIRHHKPVEQMIGIMKSLSKAEEPVLKEPDLGEHLFQDPLIPALANLHSFGADSSSNGVWVMMHANDLPSVSRIHGQKEQEDALRAVGNGIAEALKENGGRIGWHLDGDHFISNFPAHEEAAKFLRDLRGKLEKVTLVGGTHKLSVNAGMGNRPAVARASLAEAEKAKEGGKHLPGSSPGYAHSMVEGSEGPIAVEPATPKQP